MHVLTINRSKEANARAEKCHVQKGTPYCPEIPLLTLLAIMLSVFGLG